MPSSLQEVQNSERKFENGALVADYRLKKADGTVVIVTRIKKGSKDAAALARSKKAAGRTATVSLEDAQKAFDRFYGRTKVTRRGTIAPRFVSPRGRLSARTYDLNTSARVISDRRYLTPSGPYRYDFAGVDAGARARKAVTEAQRAKLAEGRGRRGTAEAKTRHASVRKARTAVKPKARKAKVACKPCKHQKGAPVVQSAGFWW